MLVDEVKCHNKLKLMCVCVCVLCVCVCVCVRACVRVCVQWKYATNKFSKG